MNDENTPSRSTTYADKDVLLGRLKICFNNGGNELLRGLVEERLGEYRDADRNSDYLDAGHKRDRRVIRNEVIDYIKERGGRFLQVKLDGGEVRAVDVTEDLEVLNKFLIAQFRNANRRKEKTRADGDAVQETNAPQSTHNEGESQLKPASPSTLDDTKDVHGGDNESLGINSFASMEAILEEIAADSFEDRSLVRTATDRMGPSDNLTSVTTSMRRPPPGSVSSMAFSWAASSSRVNLAMSVEDLMSNMSFSQTQGSNPLMQGSTIGTLSKISAASGPALPDTFDAPKPKEISTDARDEVDDVNAILQRVRDNIKDESALMMLMDTLLDYTLDKDNAAFSDVRESGVHLVFIDILKYYPFNEPLQRDGLYALGNLAINDHNRVAIASVGGITLAMGAMLRSNSNDQVLRTACHTLGNLSKNITNNATVVQAGGIALVGTAMRKFPSNEQVQRNGCHALGNLARNVANNIALDKAGSVDLVANAMRQFPAIDQLQWYGCLLLAHVTFERDDESLAAIANSGIIHLVLAAMRAFLKSNERIQRYGCCALGNLVVLEQNRRVISANGGIGAILDAMMEYNDNGRMQQYGCFAIGNLAVTDSIGVAVADAGGIKIVTDAMKMFPTNRELLDEACFALGNLALNSPGNARAILAHDGEMLTGLAIKTWSEELQYAAQALETLKRTSLLTDESETGLSGEARSPPEDVPTVSRHFACMDAFGGFELSRYRRRPMP